jgi:choline kinase
MSTIHHCVILAAGNGSRLVSRSAGKPKPLVEVNGVPLLEHVIVAAHEAGVTDFTIVVGYCGTAIRDWIERRKFAGITVSFVENTEYHKSNGISLLKAHTAVRKPFLLLMSDHIFEASTAKELLRQPLGDGEVILAVDSNLDQIFDLDDVTKVKRNGDHVIAIGKELVDYDAYDTGMFLCSPKVFDALEAAKQDGNCSLSDGMRRLGEAGKFRAFDIGDATWQDVDTPEALAYATTIFDHSFCTTPALEYASV